MKKQKIGGRVSLVKGHGIEVVASVDPREMDITIAVYTNGKKRIASKASLGEVLAQLGVKVKTQPVEAPITFGELMKERRGPLSQKKVAEGLAISRDRLSRIERDRVEKHDPIFLAKLFKRYGIHPEAWGKLFAMAGLEEIGAEDGEKLQEIAGDVIYYCDNEACPGYAYPKEDERHRCAPVDGGAS